MKIRVLLVEDHRLVREALSEALNRVPEIDVVGEAGNGEEALEKASALKPDVVVLDIRLPDVSGIEVAARFKDAKLSPKVIALSAFADKRFVTAMLRAGASGYVAKSAAGTELVQAIRAVSAGHGYFSPEIAGALVSEMQGGAEPLARREREVLRRRLSITRHCRTDARIGRYR